MMKTTRRGILAIATIFAVIALIGYSSHGQSDSQSTADAILQPVAPEDVPDDATFFYLSEYLDNGGSLGAPWPYLKNTNGSIYALNTGGPFLVDDTAMTNDAEALNAVALLLEPQDAFSSNMLNGTIGSRMAMDSADPNPADAGSDTNSSTDGGDASPDVMVSYPTNVLWIQVPTNSLDGAVSFNTILQNTTPDEEYDILTTTNLTLPLSNWVVEQSVLGVEGTNCSPVSLMMNGRSHLFVDARFGGSSDGSGLPDWWEYQYFGTNFIDPYMSDSSGDGWNLLDDFEHGWSPGSWHTPPPPQNFSVDFDSTGTNVVVTWQPGGGPVDHYEIDSGDDSDPTEEGDVNNETFNFTENAPFLAFTPSPRRVVAVFSNGDRSATVWKWPNLVRSAVIFRGAGGQYYLAIPNVPQDLAEIDLVWDPATASIERLDPTNLVDGILQFPQDDQLNIAQGVGPYIQLVSLNTNESGYINPTFAIFPEHQLGIATAVTNFANASAHMKENLRFLFRGAGALWPFGYSSGIGFSLDSYSKYQIPPDPSDANTPETSLARNPAATNYEYYGYHTFSPHLNFSIMDELRPVEENFLWRNFIYNPVDFLGGELDIDLGWEYNPYGTTFSEVYGATYQYTGSGTETNLPLAFNLSTSGWIFFPDALGGDAGDTNLGISIQTNLEYTLENNVTNIYGLGLQSAYGNTNFISLGSTVPYTSSEFFPVYENFAAPDLQIVDYYFNSQTPWFNYTAYYTNAYPYESLPPYSGSPPVLPGSPSFSTTNTSPLLITGIGQPITVSGWAKMAITNGDPNKFGYLEQYFDFAQSYTTNGVPPTNSVGLLSPYGDFFPTVPGPAALVTMADFDSGQRGTSVVNVVKLQLDVNHDGTMDLSFGGPDNTSQAHPFEFWINNDDDGMGIGEDIDIGTNFALADCNQGEIRSERNLEDFARMWICGVPALPYSLIQTSSPYAVTLSWQNTVGNPAINLYGSCETNGGVGYLSDTNIAALQILESYGQSIGTVSTNAAYVFPNTTFVFGGTQYLLFEGAGVGSGQLVLTIWQGTNILAQTSQWINLHDVTDFFEQAYATNVTSGKPPSSLMSDFSVIHTAKSPLLNETKQITVFIHGINNTPTDYETTSRTIFKRLYWAGYHGRFASFRWPCAYLPPTTANPFEFNLGEFYAFKSATALKNYLNDLKNNRADLAGYAIDLYAHSQGNVVASEAIVQGAPFDNYILTQGAFPAHCYDTNAPFLQQLLDAETNSANAVQTPFYPVDGGYHGYCSSIHGNLIDFYNTNDFALATGTTFGLQTNWKEDQRTQKPEAFIGGPSYIYDTNTLITTGYYTFGSSYVVTDLQEIKALVARSRSAAVGAQGGLHGAISGSVDLFGSYGFGNIRSEHSAQFFRPIQTCLPYYRQMLTSFQIVTP